MAYQQNWDSSQNEEISYWIKDKDKKNPNAYNQNTTLSWDTNQN